MNLIANHLLIFVFLTGAASLSIEVAAVRILAPYFGNTIFTFSSVISVVLAALSFGYYYGGILADKHPKRVFFYLIILLSGVSITFFHLLLVFSLPKLAYQFSIIYGPLITSVLFFLIPSFFLGMLSPYAIKLLMTRENKSNVGTIAGRVFFFSTIGSITGSLLTGFVLIPNLGVNEIFSYTGIFLSLLGGFPLLLKKKFNLRSLLFYLLIITSGFILSYQSSSMRTPGVIYSKDGIYEKISVIESNYRGSKARILMQDLSSSGAKYIESDELVFDYTKYYDLHEEFGVNVKEALFIGGGSYAMPYALHHDDTNVKIDVVEIEPQLFQIAKTYFNFKDSQRLTNHIADGRRFLHDSNKSYDYIFSDVYSSLYSIPSHFTTEEFYQLAYDKLNDGGIFLANIIGTLHRTKPSLFFSQINTFRKVFPNSYFIAVGQPGSLESQNFIFIGLKNDVQYNFEENSRLNENILKLSRFNYKDHLFFTDNYAPVDYYTATLLQRSVNPASEYLNGEEMFSMVSQKVGYGSGYLGSENKKDVENFLLGEMEVLTDQVIVQSWRHESAQGNSYQLKNIIGRTEPEKDNRIILATHYDAKKLNNNAVSEADYVPGANDSSSGAAVLLEIARYYKAAGVNNLPGIDFILFDGEEGEPLSGPDEWKPLGSGHFASNLKNIYPRTLPRQAIVIDMVCDKNLNIYIEKSSLENAPEETQNFFDLAARLYPDNFTNKVKYEIEDDHTPLNQAGIPSFLIIDFDYPYFHTVHDTPDKCSAISLEKVAKSLVQYINSLN